MIRRWWRRVIAPTLVRRIMLAQMLLLTLLWCAFLTFVLWDSLRGPGLLAGNKTYDTIVRAADLLADRPESRYEMLHEIDLALRQDYGAGDDPAVSTSLIVRSQGQIVYASEGAPLNVRNTVYGEIERLHADGSVWRSRTARSPISDVEVTMIMPADEWNFFIHINSRGYYLLPLLVSLPFLLLMLLNIAGIRPRVLDPLMRVLANPTFWLWVLPGYALLRNLPWSPFTALAPV